MKKHWRGSKSEGEEIQIPRGGILLVMLFVDAQKRSVAAPLTMNDVEDSLKDLPAFTQWVQSAVSQKTAQTTFRLLGNEKLFKPLVQQLSQMGFVAGKNVPIDEKSRGLIQFFPLDGKIRMLKESAASETDYAQSQASPQGNVSLGGTTKTKVLVVDDSDTIRKLLSRVIDEDSEMECVATVEIPSKVEEAIEKYKPDVITLDIHMPEMDGVTLLKQLLKKHTIPCVMISALSREDGTFVLDALEAGAVDYIQKPSLAEIKTLAPSIREKIKGARFARLKRPGSSNDHANSSHPITLTSDGVDLSYLIGIGSSTGGTEALKVLLTQLPEKIPPIVIVQHIPPVFSKAFADRMNQVCAFQVKEAEDGEEVTENKALVAPGGRQMKVELRDHRLCVFINDSPPVNRHKPSVDYLFDSIAALNRKKVAAAILTGMGADGARGLLKLRQTGAKTFAQDEETSVVYGMPKEAFRLGGVEKVLPLNQIAGHLLKACALKSRNNAA